MWLMAVHSVQILLVELLQWFSFQLHGSCGESRVLKRTLGMKSKESLQICVDKNLTGVHSMWVRVTAPGISNFSSLLLLAWFTT